MRGFEGRRKKEERRTGSQEIWPEAKTKHIISNQLIILSQTALASSTLAKQDRGRALHCTPRTLTRDHERARRSLSKNRPRLAQSEPPPDINSPHDDLPNIIQHPNISADTSLALRKKETQSVAPPALFILPRCRDGNPSERERELEGATYP